MKEIWIDLMPLRLISARVE